MDFNNTNERIIAEQWYEDDDGNVNIGRGYFHRIKQVLIK